MTLLGKLFRPWDLPQENVDGNQEESHPAIGAPNFNSLPKAKIFACDKSESLMATRKVSQKRDIGHDGSKSIHERRLEKKKRDDGKVNRDPFEVKRDDPAGDRCGSECSNDPWPQCSTDCSPATLESSQSPLFLHSSAINNLANLSRSELTAMGLLPPDVPSHKVKRQRPKRFHCPHCQVAFSNNGQLRGHIRIHTGERPFSCEHDGCGKSFTRNEELTRHRRIHSGLRPFPCTYCGKKFGRKDHLKKHTRTHQRPMFNGGMIGFTTGNPFHSFNNSHPLLGPDFGAVQPSYGLPFVLNMPPPSSHFHFS